MDSMEPKKLALIRIWQILKEHSDYDHPLKQEEISKYLEKDYGIFIERKAIGRNISLLKEAGVEIASRRAGSYIEQRDFEDAELHMLIDGVLSSKYITATHSKDLIERISSLSNKYFKSSIRYIHSVNDWSKTDNQELFLNIESIGDALEQKCQIKFDYNKYDTNKRLRKSSTQIVSPYQMILHNQRYYLMAYSERFQDITYYRVDRITNLELTVSPATPLKSIPGYENGINYKLFSTSMPYMFSDTPEKIELVVDKSIIDQIIDWFGTSITIKRNEDENKVNITLKASPKAMQYWAMQYIDYVEVIQPISLRNNIKKSLEDASKKYDL